MNHLNENSSYLWEWKCDLKFTWWSALRLWHVTLCSSTDRDTNWCKSTSINFTACHSVQQKYCHNRKHQALVHYHMLSWSMQGFWLTNTGVVVSTIPMSLLLAYSHSLTQSPEAKMANLCPLLYRCFVRTHFFCLLICWRQKVSPNN